jgi:hypothetical protein
MRVGNLNCEEINSAGDLNAFQGNLNGIVRDKSIEIKVNLKHANELVVDRLLDSNPHMIGLAWVTGLA